MAASEGDRWPAEPPVQCTFCGRRFDEDDAHLLVMREGEVVAAYHEGCRPDRRRNGCAGC
ncbi:MAG: hypothetical protein IPK85_23380 [Gemmatimonadetes bacterium]|nr:hypothetical protein [Gemmatimonadota bacterium]